MVDGDCVVVVVVVVVVTSVSFLAISLTLSERTQEQQQLASMAHNKNGTENFRNLMMGAVSWIQQALMEIWKFIKISFKNLVQIEINSHYCASH